MSEVATHLTDAIPATLAGEIARCRASGRYRHILFVAGPGDVAGTYLHWRAGRDDPSIPSLGYSQQIYELAEKIGARLSVLSEHPLPPGLTADGAVRFVRCRSGGGRSVVFHVRQIFYVLRVVGHGLRFGADTIVFQRNVAHFWPLALARLLGIVILISLHNGLWPMHREPSRRERILNILNGWAFRRICLGVMCIGQVVRGQVLRAAGPGFARTDFHVPQYGGAWGTAWRPRDPGRPLRRMVYVGRIEDNKGVFLLLAAFQRLAPAHPGIELTYVGSGGDLERLRSAAADGPAPRRVHVRGPLDGAGVAAELARSDLLVCPTTARFTEGLAKTPIEAALCGVPSLVSTAVPCAELLEGASRVFRTDDLDDLQSSLGALIEHPEALGRMNAAAKSRRQQFLTRERSLGARLLCALAAGIEPNPCGSRQHA